MRRVRKISNAHIFEPIVARDVARHRLVDEILSFFGRRAQPMMAQLAGAGKITLEDVRELEKTIEKLELETQARKGEEIEMTTNGATTSGNPRGSPSRWDF